MKIHSLLIYLCISFVTITSQAQDYDAIDAKVKSYPRYTSPEALTKRIQSDFTSPSSKLRAAFTWIAHNIWYDMEEYRNPKQRYISFSYSTEEERKAKLQQGIDKLVYSTFRKKKGVCEEYAQSLKKVCDLLAIEAEVVRGYVRNNPAELEHLPSGTNHAWNAVKIDNQWLFLDATWAAGYAMNGDWRKEFNDYFYDIPKEKLALSHFPDDRKWRRGLGVQTLKEYYAQPIYHNPFLDTSLNIKNPSKGIIYIDKNTPITITLEGRLTGNRLRYSYYGQQYSYEPTIVSEGNKHTVQIKNPGVTTYLFLVLNNINAVTYRVVVR